ncbi:MAG: hypothetical protein FJY55_14195 [Betaproteobacteria bacterium]|nr:hypothetical protein [Betaproteobacteria bacterium]
MRNNDSAEQLLLDRVCRALSANRKPGLHFPGHYLGLHSLGSGNGREHLALQYGPHCANADGSVNIATMALLADMGLSAAMRRHLDAPQRMATLTLHLQFTGAVASGVLSSEAEFEGFVAGTTAVQGRCRGGFVRQEGNRLEFVWQLCQSACTPRHEACAAALG